MFLMKKSLEASWKDADEIACGFINADDSRDIAKWYMGADINGDGLLRMKFVFYIKKYLLTR